MAEKSTGFCEHSMFVVILTLHMEFGRFIEAADIRCRSNNERIPQQMGGSMMNCLVTGRGKLGCRGAGFVRLV